MFFVGRLVTGFGPTSLGINGRTGKATVFEQFRRSEPKFNAAIHHGRSCTNVAVGVGQFGQLPEEAGIGRQPERKLLSKGQRFGGQLLALFRGELARLVFSRVADVANTEEVVEVLRAARLALALPN